jgi:hypothetical protein
MGEKNININADYQKHLSQYITWGFWSAMALWVLAALFPRLGATIVYALIWIAVVIFGFVNCLRYLASKPTKKAFAITALVILSFLVLLFVIGIMAGAIIGIIGEL